MLLVSTYDLIAAKNGLPYFCALCTPTPVTFFNYNCIEMNKFEFKVEYLSPEKVSRFFEGKVKNTIIEQRPRFFSESLNKKSPSFEILCFDESKDTVINTEYFSQRKPTCIKNVHKNSPFKIEPIEDDDEYTDELCLSTESNDKETTVSNVKKRMKASDTTSFESSYSFQNSYELEMESDIRRNSTLSRSIFGSEVSSFGKLKRKMSSAKGHSRIDLCRLSKLIK